MKTTRLRFHASIVVAVVALLIGLALLLTAGSAGKGIALIALGAIALLLAATETKSPTSSAALSSTSGLDGSIVRYCALGAAACCLIAVYLVVIGFFRGGVYVYFNAVVAAAFIVMALVLFRGVIRAFRARH